MIFFPEKSTSHRCRSHRVFFIDWLISIHQCEEQAGANRDPNRQIERRLPTR